MIVMPFIARAEDVPINPNAKIITDSYLQGALLNKQDKLSDANIIINGDDTGDVITNISASNGVLTITKGTMPSGVNVVYDGNADFPIITNVVADDDGNVTVTRGSVPVIQLSENGSVVTDVSVNSEGTVAVTRGNIQIPVGDENGTQGFSAIWVQ